MKKEINLKVVLLLIMHLFAIIGFTTLYADYIKWANWDGKLPSTVAEGSNNLLNIK